MTNRSNGNKHQRIFGSAGASPSRASHIESMPIREGEAPAEPDTLNRYDPSPYRNS